MSQRSDEIAMGNPKSIYSFSYHNLVMLPLYQLISKRILYNIPTGEKIFLFQNDYVHAGL